MGSAVLGKQSLSRALQAQGWLCVGQVVVSMITRGEYGTACEGDIVTQYEL